MVDISSAMVGRRRVADGRSVVAWIGPLVGVILIFTVLNPQYRWFTTDREFEISPGRVLDIVTLVLIVLVLHVLRSLHRIQAEAKLVTAAALILVSGVVTAISMASVALDTEMLHRANVGAGMTITALTIALSLDLRSPHRFASFCLLAAGGVGVFGRCCLCWRCVSRPEPMGLVHGDGQPCGRCGRCAHGDRASP